MKTFAAYLLARLRERSTWLGLISLTTALGLLLSAAQQEAVVAAGMALAGLVGAFMSDPE
jgi:hypothetical protein